jgi:hypothetical protein
MDEGKKKEGHIEHEFCLGCGELDPGPDHLQSPRHGHALAVMCLTELERTRICPCCFKKGVASRKQVRWPCGVAQHEEFNRQVKQIVSEPK